jgi:hypothetical protein
VGVALDDAGHFGLEHEAAVVELLRADLAQLVPAQRSQGGDAERTAAADVGPVAEALPAEGLQAAGDGLRVLQLPQADYAVHTGTLNNYIQNSFFKHGLSRENIDPPVV